MHKKTEEILQIFEELSKIPRRSKHEERLIEWLLNWAEEHELEATRDEAGNVLIKAPASSKAYQNSPTVVIQGHMDMVCEKLPDSNHDFSKDPIQLVYDGDWLKANGTTLGADNGIALALGLALATDDNIKHPPLELLFTRDEEAGMTGAKGLQPGFIEGRILLNLDSEEEGLFTAGCAGGKSTDIALPLEYESVPAQYRAYQVKAGEMQGGHSGVDINDQRANAIRILCRVLDAFSTKWDTRISLIQGGTVRNAIPRDAEAIVFLPEADGDNYSQFLAEIESTLRDEYKNTDPNLTLTITPYEDIQDDRAMTAGSTRKTLDLLFAIPHGVDAMSTEIKNAIETSNNLAKVSTEEGKLQVQTSQRSSVWSRVLALTNRIEAIARLAGGEAQSTEGYPGWQPNWDSPLIEKCQKVYKRVFRKQPRVEVIHGGLECGMIGDTYPGMDMIAFGPTIKNPHSPSERIEIESIGKIWDFMVALLRNLK